MSADCESFAPAAPSPIARIGARIADVTAWLDGADAHPGDAVIDAVPVARMMLDNVTAARLFADLCTAIADLDISAVADHLDALWAEAGL